MLSLASLAYACPLLLLLVVAYYLLARPCRRDSGVRAAVVVSVAPGVQSPRALAHARALGVHTSLTPVLVAQTPLPGGLSVIPIVAQAPAATRTPLVLIVRLVRAILALVDALERARAQHSNIAFVVLNVPPALPALPIAWVWVRLRARGAGLVVDWHNTSHSILRTTGAPRLVVVLAAALERRVARLADTHWCVSEAMRAYLAEWAGVRAAVVRDTPPAHFKVGSRDAPGETHALLLRVAGAAGALGSFRKGETALTCARGTKWREDAARVVVSSTSWTPDEDFSVLFAALRAIDGRLRAGEDVDCDETEVRLLVVITGRGPMRAAFEERVRRAELRAVRVWCAWVTRDDYAGLLALADLGVSMHSSSSGLDLPMKVVDMLGCGLPVAAFRYECIGELVRDGENGVLFGDAQELVAVLRALLFDKGGNRRLAGMRRTAARMYPPLERWVESWKREALPTLSKL